MATTILIDNGHGCNTSGKKSPDGKLQEWRYVRNVATEVADRLYKAGYRVKLVVPETTDVSLAERVRRVNQAAKENGGDAILVSIHLNAAGDGSNWLNASGWECYTTKGTTKSDTLAEYLCNAAHQHLKEFNLRVDKSDGDQDKEANFYILKNTSCPAVLTENLFMDSKKDYNYLLSQEGFENIVRVHITGIVNYLNSIK